MVVNKVNELKKIVLDVEKNIFLLNGERIGGNVSQLTLEFKNERWLLQIVKDEFYQAATKKII